MKAAFTFLALLITGNIFLSHPVHAQDYNARQDDLEIELKATWAGCEHGGYWPLRVHIVNRGGERKISLRCKHNNNMGQTPDVTKDLVIKSGETIEQTLLWPVVSYFESTLFEVWVEGKSLPSMSQHLNLKTGDSNSNYPSILMIARDTTFNQELLKKAIEHQTQADSATRSRYSSSEQDFGFIDAYNKNLPAQWIAYAGVDLLISDSKSLMSLNPQKLNAIVQWVQSGGKLYLIESTPLNPLKETIKTMLGHGGTSISGDTSTFILNKHDVTLIEVDPATSGVIYPKARSKDFNVTNQTTEITRLPVMLGEIDVIPYQAEDLSIADWQRILSDNNLNADTLRDRYGITSRIPQSDFLGFFIPGVGKVPVFAFLIMITLFTIVIGPVNYSYFQRRKQLSMLLVSIPAISFGTSILLVSYAVFSQGFGIKGRIDSTTFVDQSMNTAVTFAREALYAGQAPSRMNFKTDTAVFPLWGPNAAFESGRVNWTDDQQILIGSWLRSRTRTQFFTINHREERGRLQVEAVLGKELPVTNGFAQDLSHLVVLGPDEKFYYGQDIKAGATARLNQIADPEELKQFHSVWNPKIKNPDGDTTYNTRNWNNQTNQYDVSYSNNVVLTRQITSALTTEGPIGNLPAPYNKHTYFAVYGERPELDQGVNSISESASIYRMVGRY
jgi:hypothetical protein